MGLTINYFEDGVCKSTKKNLSTEDTPRKKLRDCPRAKKVWGVSNKNQLASGLSL